MEGKKYDDAKKMAKRMKRLISDAKKSGLHFAIVDDYVHIGDINISTSWESLIGERKIGEFLSSGFIAAVGA